MFGPIVLRAANREIGIDWVKSETLKLRRAERAGVARSPARSGVHRSPDTAIVAVVNDRGVGWGKGNCMSIGVEPYDARHELAATVDGISEDVHAHVAADIGVIRVGWIDRDREVISALATGESIGRVHVHPGGPAIGGLVDRASILIGGCVNGDNSAHVVNGKLHIS